MRHALTRIYNDAVLGHYNNNAITVFLPEVVYQFPSFSAGYYVVSEDDFMESYPCQPWRNVKTYLGQYPFACRTWLKLNQEMMPKIELIPNLSNKRFKNAQYSSISMVGGSGIIFLIRMRNLSEKMSYKTILTQLFFILIYADGHVNEHERYSGKSLIKAEGLEEEDFNDQLELLKSKDRPAMLVDCVSALKKLHRNQQIRIIAWLCVVANGDGFMDRMEWQLIYKIYHKELGLPLEEIFKVQKELNRASREKFAA